MYAYNVAGEEYGIKLTASWFSPALGDCHDVGDVWTSLPSPDVMPISALDWGLDPPQDLDPEQPDGAGAPHSSIATEQLDGQIDCSVAPAAGTLGGEGEGGASSLPQQASSTENDRLSTLTPQPPEPES